MQYLGSAERQTEPYALASREKKYKRIAAYLSFWIVGYARVREPLSWTPGLYQYRCPWCHAWDRNSPSHVKSTFSYASPHLTVANESDMFGQKHVDWVYQMLGGDPIQTASCVFIQNRFFFFFFSILSRVFFNSRHVLFQIWSFQKHRSSEAPGRSAQEARILSLSIGLGLRSLI